MQNIEDEDGKEYDDLCNKAIQALLETKSKYREYEKEYGKGAGASHESSEKKKNGLLTWFFDWFEVSPDDYKEEEEEEKELPLTKCLDKLKSEKGYDNLLNEDMHYEPLQPDAYIKFRIMPIINFYRSRIPVKSRVRYITQCFMVLGSIASAGLGFVDLAQWAGGVAIITSAVTAYLEFSGTNSKIRRYSFTVHQLHELIYWWQTLRPIDRAAVHNIDRLILTAEELLQKEQHAWKSTSHSIKMLKKASEGENGKMDTPMKDE